MSSWHRASAGCKAALSTTFSSCFRTGVGEVSSLDWRAPEIAMARWASPSVSSTKELRWKPWVALIQWRKLWDNECMSSASVQRSGEEKAW